MPDSRRRLGAFGESAAHAYILRQGYTVLAKGWRCAIGELDLVAQDGESLVFIEVRTKKGEALLSPEESVTASKQSKLIALAQTYLESEQIAPERDWRIDVIGIVVGKAGRIERLTHTKFAVGES
jgi:putative endonuclease